VIIARGAQPARITVVHRDPERAETVARKLRSQGHRVHIISTGQKLERAIIDSSPELLIGPASFTNPSLGPVVGAVRQALGDIPFIALLDEGEVASLIEADAIVREPLQPGELEVAAAGLLRPREDTRALRQKVRELLGLYRISWGLSLEGGAEALFGHLAKESAELLKCEKGAVVLYDADRRQMAAQNDAYGLTREQVARTRYVVDGEARSRWNFRKNGPLVSNNAQADTRLIREYSEELELRSLMLVPLTRGPRVLGLLMVGDRKQDAPIGDEELNLLAAAAGEAAVAVENLRLHEELKQANARLQEYDRLKSEFVAIVAHDFRRPLTAIRGFAELVMEEPDIDAETRTEYMRTVVTETDGLALLANDTLLITRIETGEFEYRWTEIDLGPFLLEAVPLGLTDHSVLMDVPPDFPKLVADKDRLRQVVTNLVSNAVKYSPQGGTITLRCRERGPLHIGIEVVDSGLGIPKEQIGKLFQKFERVRSDEHLAISGTGLGLYICRLIVEGHGGQMWVESELGKGSTFGLVLPVDARAAQESRKKLAADQDPPVPSAPVTEDDKKTGSK